VETTELIDLGDRFVLLGSVRTRGSGSGVRLTQSFAWVTTLEKGKVSHQYEYLDHAEALEAAGLTE
jgi:ketosteroid isomerase-like protein